MVSSDLCPKCPKMMVKIFCVKKLFFLPTDQEKSHQVTGNDNIFLLGLTRYKVWRSTWNDRYDTPCNRTETLNTLKLIC